MNYGDQSANQAQGLAAMVKLSGIQGDPQPPSLMRDSGRIADRLLDLYGRVTKLGDTLCGSAPTPIAGSGGAPSEVSNNVRRNLDTSCNWIARLEEAVTRIENAL